MTLEELLGKSASEMEALTTQELNEFFAPYLQYTRPELANKSSSTKKPVNYAAAEKQAKKDKTNEILKQLGIDLKL